MGLGYLEKGYLSGRIVLGVIALLVAIALIVKYKVGTHASHATEESTIAKEETREILYQGSEAKVSDGGSSPPSGEFKRPIDFIKYYRLAESKGELDEVMKQYANEVEYFGDERSSSWIKEEKAGYWKKWPVRTEEISSIVNEKLTGRKEWTVSFNTTFKDRDPKEKTWVSGVLANEYTVVKRNQRFYVTRQTAVRLQSQESKYRIYGPELPEKKRFEEKKTFIIVSSDSKESKYPRLSAAFKLIRRVRESEKERHIEGVVSGYAQEVDYFGKKMSPKEIYQDKVDFYMRWPISKESRTSAFNLGLGDRGEDSLEVTFTSTFKYSNELEGRWRMGTFANTYILSDASGKMLIVGQSAKISDLKKSDP